MDPITVQVTVEAPLEKVWEYWTLPEHIVEWAFASEGWEAVDPVNNVVVGEKFKTTMQAKDGPTPRTAWTKHNARGTCLPPPLLACIRY